jgi:hypothetical protein
MVAMPNADDDLALPGGSRNPAQFVTRFQLTGVL